jgi:hypothetical protein
VRRPDPGWAKRRPHRLLMQARPLPAEVGCRLNVVQTCEPNNGTNPHRNISRTALAPGKPMPRSHSTEAGVVIRTHKFRWLYRTTTTFALGFTASHTRRCKAISSRA